MTQHWSAANGCFEIFEMPFYWRLSESMESDFEIPSTLPMHVSINSDYDYLAFEPNKREWANLVKAYKKDENIGFLNPESGQLQSYGSSVNNFFHSEIRKYRPESIYEIGCGAGFSIQFLKENGWDAIGIDPSEYSLRWSAKLGFNLINKFFREGLLKCSADFIYCNDVFEHVREVREFSKLVYENLSDDGVFCIATTNSTQSIAIGDISMLEHQHVNMFTERSIHLILREAGFSDIEILCGSYGNTFHVTARKSRNGSKTPLPSAESSCKGYFDRAEAKVKAFGRFYDQTEKLHCYVPLRSLPYLATVGDFGHTPIYDSNEYWRGKYIDGYAAPIRNPRDIEISSRSKFFVGSLTFYDEIRAMLIGKDIEASNIFSINDLP